MHRAWPLLACPLLASIMLSLPPCLASPSPSLSTPERVPAGIALSTLEEAQERNAVQRAQAEAASVKREAELIDMLRASTLASNPHPSPSIRALRWP